MRQPQRVEKVNLKILHAGRLREMEQNFAFSERELYIGTASELNAKNAKQRRNIEFLRCFHNVTLKRVVGDADPYNRVITVTTL